MSNDGDHSLREAAASAAFILPLGAVGADERRRVGGKAAALTLLLRAELPVPRGFCLTIDAFRHFLANADAGMSVAELAAVHPDDVDGLATVGESLRSRLRAAPLPLDLEHAILSAWDRVLAGAACAVRSSATAEDLSDASFAGQQDTFLNICDRAALLTAVRQCWASLFSDRALAYRARRGIDQSDVAMAVIVQELVSAAVAGVLFTTNPLTGRANEILIEASYGLGEAVVSGRVSPDRFVIDRNSQAVTQRALGSKTIAVVSDPGGGVRERAVGADESAAASLSDIVAQRVAQLGLAAERVFGAPQDVEWAVAGGEVVLLQSRPITVPRIAQERPQVWTNMNVGEVLPDVVSPMTWSFLDVTLLRLFRELLASLGFEIGDTAIVGRVAGRAYFNLNSILTFLRAVPTGSAAGATALFGGLQSELEEFGGLAALDADLPRATVSPWRLLRHLPGVVRWCITQTANAAERRLATLTRRLDELKRRDLNDLTEGALIAALRACADQFRETLMTTGGYVIAGTIYFSNLDNLGRRWLSEEHSIASQLLTGLGGLSSADAGLGMWELAAAADADSAVKQALFGSKGFAAARTELGASDGGAVFLSRWDAFMARHGHHARGEIELMNRRWCEEPDYVLEQVRSYVRNIGGKDPVAIHRAQAGERVRRAAAFRHRLSPVKRVVFDFLLRRAQRGIRYRENLKSEAVRLIAVMRHTALTLGQRAVARGALGHRDDIFFVALDELDELHDPSAARALRGRVSARKAEHEEHQSITPPAVVVGTFDTRAAARAAEDDACEQLTGLGVSAGVVTGPARVILRSATNERMLPGEILVAPFTDPGWTPYFQLAAGLVTDLGGLLSHGSIVAREYGLPAVVNVGRATRVIRTGDQLYIDGTRGEVRILR